MLCPLDSMPDLATSDDCDWKIARNVRRARELPLVFDERECLGATGREGLFAVLCQKFDSIERRQFCDMTKQRETTLRRKLIRIRRSIDRMMTAYQEDLMPLDELRRRMPALRQREQANQSELQSIIDQVTNREAYLRLAGTLSAFLTRVRSAAETLSILDRQRTTRLLVKEILVGDTAITLRHSIPVPAGLTGGGPLALPERCGETAASSSFR